MDEDEDEGPHGSPRDREGARAALCGETGCGRIPVRAGYGLAERV